MKGLFGLFAQSPWKPLNQHMQKSYECVGLVRPITEAFLGGQTDEVEKLFKTITRVEHEADMIKDQIRDHMPKSLFMSVDRRDFLVLLASQDAIPDLVEDLGMLYMIRPHTKLAEPLRQPFDELLDATLRVVDWTKKVLEDLDTLVEASFSGSPREQALKAIDEAGKLEHEADVSAYRFARMLYQHEDVMSPLDIIMISKIERTLSSLANAAERVCKQIRLIVAK